MYVCMHVLQFRICLNRFHNVRKWPIFSANNIFYFDLQILLYEIQEAMMAIEKLNCFSGTLFERNWQQCFVNYVTTILRQDCDLASHTTHVCVCFLYPWIDYSKKFYQNSSKFYRRINNHATYWMRRLFNRFGFANCKKHTK